jgi:hypothetical protein
MVRTIGHMLQILVLVGDPATLVVDPVRAQFVVCLCAAFGID